MRFNFAFSLNEESNLKLIQLYILEVIERWPSGPCEIDHITDLAKISRDLQKTKLKNSHIEAELTEAKNKTQRKKQVKNDLEEQLKLKLLELEMIQICEEVKAINVNIKKLEEERSRLKDEIRVLEEQLEHLKSSGLIFFSRRSRISYITKLNLSDCQLLESKRMLIAKNEFQI